MERASVEITLCVMRGAADIARIENKTPKPCYCCGVFENNQNMPYGGIYHHYYIFCAPASFLLQFLNILFIRICGVPVTLTTTLLIFNEIPHDICKRLNDNQKKTFFCIFNAYKATLFSLYYARPTFLSDEILLRKFKENLDVAKNIAAERKCVLTADISIPLYTGRTFQTFQSIKADILDLTKHLRRSDNATQRSIFLNNNRLMCRGQLNTNIPRAGRSKKSVKKPSLAKRQILIQEAFARLPKKTLSRNGNLELAG